MWGLQENKKGFLIIPQVATWMNGNYGWRRDENHLLTARKRQKKKDNQPFDYPNIFCWCFVMFNI